MTPPRSSRDADRQFLVDCPRHDGTSRIFSTYATREQAEAAAAQLRRVGCVVRVHGPDELDFDPLGEPG